jgi:hypothetical protein
MKLVCVGRMTRHDFEMTLDIHTIRWRSGGICLPNRPYRHARCGSWYEAYSGMFAPRLDSLLRLHMVDIEIVGATKKMVSSEKHLLGNTA